MLPNVLVSDFKHAATGLWSSGFRGVTNNASLSVSLMNESEVGGGIMIWGCLSGVPVKGTLNASAPRHFGQLYASNLEELDWPGKIPDLNPIKHL